MSNSRMTGLLTHSRKWVLYAVGVLTLLLVPFLVPNQYVFRIVIAVLIAAPLALAQNLITGFTGMLSVGQAAFYGIGAYTSSLLVLRLGVPWLLALLAAGVLACVLGILLGFPCLRVGSDYLTLMTIAFNMIFITVALHWMGVTRGSMGIPGIPPPRIAGFAFNTNTRYYYLYLFLTALCYASMYFLIHSHVGRAMIATREDQTAAATAGINVAYYKVLAFAIGTFWAGLAGSMSAHFLAFVGPSMFTIDESLLQMQMAIIGGLGSLPGSILGAAILVSIPQIFQGLYEYRMLFSGLVMVVLMIWRPQGIMGVTASSVSAGGWMRRWFDRRKKRRADGAIDTSLGTEDVQR